MQQLPLEVRLADYAVFETYCRGPNAAPVHALQELSKSDSGSMLWLWGPPQSGKTHLLQACVTAAHAQGYRAAYLPVGGDSDLVPAAISGAGDLDLVCIDDADRVARHQDWEHAMFVLYEQVRQASARLVISGQQAPMRCGFELLDLASRFSSGATFRLKALSDADKLKAMQLRAGWRGLDLPDDVARYLFARVDRSNAELFALLDRLDREALAAQRKLTVPFVKSVIEN
jgi:DnaA family protein